MKTMYFESLCRARPRRCTYETRFFGASKHITRLQALTSIPSSSLKSSQQTSHSSQEARKELALSVVASPPTLSRSTMLAAWN